MKGADVAMASIVQYNDWLEEEVQIWVISKILLDTSFKYSLDRTGSKKRKFH